MISDHIKDIITAAKELRKDPSLDKESLNRGISSLSNALYAFEHAEMGYESKSSPRQLESPANGQLGYDPLTLEGCICPEGARDASCPVRHVTAGV